MTDKELLGLAAKAAGLNIVGWVAGRNNLQWAELDCSTKWNAMHDDGDALRLAVKLDMTVCFHGLGIHAKNPNGKGASSPECSDADKPALVRRAIVRAAAAIGGSMP